MQYSEQKKEIENGIPKQFLCHIQEIKESGIVYPAHFHDYMELLYCYHGVFEIYIDGKSVLFKKGDLLVIHPKEVHKIDALEGGSYIVLRFDPEIIYNILEYHEYKYYLPILFKNIHLKKIISKQETSTSFISDLFESILYELTTQEYGYELAVKSMISQVYLWLIRFWNQSSADPQLKERHFLFQQIKPVFDYVAINYQQDITAEDMAKLCNMSYSYFSRKFKKLMNLSFPDYVNLVRIDEAIKLLISTDASITEVAEQCGFCSISYFIKVFQKYRSITPLQFKKLITA